MISRLGETFSPERDSSSLKHTQLLAWTRFRAQNTQVTSRSRLGKCLSPEREASRSTLTPGRLGEKREPTHRHETLQLSLRRDGLAWEKIAEVLLWSHAKTAKTMPTHNTNNTKQVIFTSTSYEQCIIPFWFTKTKGLTLNKQYSTVLADIRPILNRLGV